MSRPSLAVAVVIPAAGAGVRLGGSTPKALRILGGRTVLQHSIDAMCSHPSVVQVVVAAPRASVDTLTEELAGGLIPLRVVPGGASRQASVGAALSAVAASCDAVLVHDAARPLVPARLVARVVDGLAAGAAVVVPGLPVTDTIKRIDEAEMVVETLPRHRLRAIQTPQGFRREVLLEAHRAAGGYDDATDDAALAERAGFPVLVVPGDEEAMKITGPDDLERAERLIQRRERT